MSKGDPSNDPGHFPLKVDVGASRDETVIAGLSELGQLARNAFEDKRRKQCLALTTAILKIDPDNKEALVIQAWVREDLVKDVTSARQQVEEARRESSLGLWDRAERLLRGVINVDPDHEEAKALMAEVIPAQRALAEANPIDDDAAALEGRNSHPLGRTALIVFGTIAAALIVFFVFRPAPKPEPSDSTKDGTAQTPAPAPAEVSDNGSFEFFVLPQQGVQLSVDGAAAQAVPPKLDLAPGPHALVFTAEGYESQTINETIMSGRNKAVPVIMKSTSAGAATTTDKKPEPPPKSSDPPKSTATARGPAAPPEPRTNTPPPAQGIGGSLAISAAVPVEVFLAGKNIGTTPITVKLPAGVQTVEYRFQGQTKSGSYQIRPNEMARATIAFDVTLQINAYPWAQVMLDGPEGRTLGQTPLSNVLVPAGSVLVFQYPNFPDQRVRVTGTEPAIQVRFQ